MRISDLSRASGVPIPTIKFYLRAGILPPGERSAKNQASYDERHLRRLRLVRVLADVGDLGLSSIRGILEALDRPDEPLHETLAVAHTAIGQRTRPADPSVAAARARTDAWLGTLGWDLSGENPAHDDLAAALAALGRLGWPQGPEVFAAYAEHASELAERELAVVAEQPDRAAAVEVTVVGTVVFERAFAALRRLAQEHHSRRRFGKAGS